VNLFDRLLLAVAPEKALRNYAARSALSQVRGLARRSGKRFSSDENWNRNTGRVEDALAPHVVKSRKVRRLLATNPYAVKVRQTLLNNLVGFGITGTPAKGAPKKLIEHWQRWLPRADWMGRLDFYGLQDQAVGEMIAEECFVVRRFDKGLPGVVPTRIEVISADMLAPGTNGEPIEYDDAGRPVKYTFRAQRHVRNGSISLDTVTFEAKDVVHLFRQEHPGQTRGRSVFEPVVKRFEDLEHYIDAEVVRKGVEACFAAFVTPSAEYAAEATDMGAESDEYSENDFELELLEPGMIKRMRPGDEVNFGDPKPSAGIREFARVVLLGATTGAGVPYEHGTGDLSNVNYSSYRAGSLEFQRFCGRLQWLLIIPVMLERIWDWFCEDAYQTGMTAKRWYPMDWAPPAFESIDRAKDVKADIMEMGAGITSRRRVVAARGWQHDDVAREIAEDLALTEGELGLQFQGDPRAGLNAATGDASSGEDDNQTKKGKTDDGS
jgi:lambda family phage portal protein